MKQHDWLFPHKFRRFGWALFALVSSLRLSLEISSFGAFLDSLNVPYMSEILNNVMIIGFAVSLLLIAFSREKKEDEMIQRLRLQALQWSVYANYLLLIICALVFYDGNFFQVMIINMYAVLIVFVITFRWTIHRMNRISLS